MASKKPVFEVQQTSDSIAICFSSTFAHIDQVCEETRFFLTSRLEGIEKDWFAIHLVLREGLTNAVRHGNQGDPEKMVQFSASVIFTGLNGPQTIKIVIEDAGEGFNWQAQQKIQVDDDEDHGRGFAIMTAYFSRYAYNEKGNILYLEKDLAPR